MVARGGLRSLTYRAVAAEAGVAHSLVSHYFGSRDALIADALTYAVRVSAGFYDGITEGDSVDTFLALLPDLVSRNPDLQAFQYELLLESRRTGELAEQAQLLYDTYTGATRDALAKVGVTADDALTLLVFAALDGLVLHQLVVGKPAETEKSLARLRQLLSRER